MSALAHSYCVFRVGGAILALDTLMVGEVATVEAVTRLPGCAHAVRGVASLRGRSIAIIDVAAIFELAPAPVQPLAADELLTVVLRLPGCECGLLVQYVDGVLLADPTGRRGVNHAAEPAWIAAFQTFAIAGAPTLTAAVIDAGELALRLERLRPARQSTVAA